jgi:Wiskott-Aldrich syndrome protein
MPGILLIFCYLRHQGSVMLHQLQLLLLLLLGCRLCLLQLAVEPLHLLPEGISLLLHLLLYLLLHDSLLLHLLLQLLLQVVSLLLQLLLQVVNLLLQLLLQIVNCCCTCCSFAC